MIYAYGVKAQLDYRLIRPFNFIGPNLTTAQHRGSRRGKLAGLPAQFLSNVMHRLPIRLVDGAQQSRSLAYIDDAIDCILRILENTNAVATRHGGIFNIVDPRNCVSVAELARRIVRIAAQFPQLEERARAANIIRRVIGRVLRSGLPGHPGPRPRDRSGARKNWAGYRRRDLDSAIHKTIAYYVAQGTGVLPFPPHLPPCGRGGQANGVSAVGWGS